MANGISQGAKAGRKGFSLAQFTEGATIGSILENKDQINAELDRLVQGLESGEVTLQDMQRQLQPLIKSVEQMQTQEQELTGEGSILPSKAFQIKGESEQQVQESLGLQPGQQLSPGVEAQIQQVQKLPGVLGEIAEGDVRFRAAAARLVLNPSEIPEKIEAAIDLGLAAGLRDLEEFGEFGAQIAEAFTGDIPGVGEAPDPFSQHFRAFRKASPFEAETRQRIAQEQGLKELAREEARANHLVLATQGVVGAASVALGPEDVAAQIPKLVKSARNVARAKRGTKTIQKALEGAEEVTRVNAQVLERMALPDIGDVESVMEMAALGATKGNPAEFFAELNRSTDAAKESTRRAFQNQIDDAMEAGQLQKAESLGEAMQEQLSQLDEVAIRLRNRHASDPVLVGEPFTPPRPRAVAAADEIADTVTELGTGQRIARTAETRVGVTARQGATQLGRGSRQPLPRAVARVGVPEPRTTELAETTARQTPQQPAAGAAVKQEGLEGTGRITPDEQQAAINRGFDAVKAQTAKNFEEANDAAIAWGEMALNELDELRRLAQDEAARLADDIVESGRPLLPGEVNTALTGLNSNRRRVVSRTNRAWDQAKLAMEAAESSGSVAKMAQAERTLQAAAQLVLHVNGKLTRGAMRRLSREVGRAVEGAPERVTLPSPIPTPVRSTKKLLGDLTPEKFLEKVKGGQITPDGIRSVVQGAGLEEAFIKFASKGRKKSEVGTLADLLPDTEALLSKSQKGKRIKEIAAKAADLRKEGETGVADALMERKNSVVLQASREKVTEFLESHAMALKHTEQIADDLPPMVREINELSLLDRFQRILDLRKQGMEMIPGIDDTSYRKAISGVVDEIVGNGQLRKSIEKIPGTKKGSCF